MKYAWLEYRQQLNDRIRAGEFSGQPFGPLQAAVNERQPAEINMQTGLLQQRVALFDLFDGKHLSDAQFDAYLDALSDQTYLLVFENLAKWGFMGHGASFLDISPVTDPLRFSGPTPQVLRLLERFTFLEPRAEDDNNRRINNAALLMLASTLDSPEAIARVASTNNEEIAERITDLYHLMITTCHRYDAQSDSTDFMRKMSFFAQLETFLDDGSVLFNQARQTRLSNTLEVIERRGTEFEVKNPDVLGLLHQTVEDQVLKMMAWMPLQKGHDSLKPFGSASSNKHCNEVPENITTLAHSLKRVMPEAPVIKDFLTTLAVQFINNRNKYTDKQSCERLYDWLKPEVDWDVISAKLTHKGREHLLKTNLESKLYAGRLGLVDKGRAICNDFGL